MIFAWKKKYEEEQERIAEQREQERKRRIAEEARAEAERKVLEAVEAAHQRMRWPSEKDAGKTDADWFWLIGYLAGKALHKPEKRLHHIITAAAVRIRPIRVKPNHSSLRIFMACLSGGRRTCRGRRCPRPSHAPWP